MLASLFPLSFLGTYSLSISSLRCKFLGIVINFPVLLSNSLNSSLVYFKNGPKYLTNSSVLLFIPLIRFLLQSLLSRSFLVRLKNSFLFFFLLSPLVWGCPHPLFPSSCKFPFSKHSVLFFAFSWFVSSISFVICLYSTYHYEHGTFFLCQIPFINR